MSQQDSPPVEPPIPQASTPYVWTLRRKLLGAALVLGAVALVGAQVIHLGAEQATTAAGRLGTDFNFENLLIDEEAIETGGVGKDDIPSLTDPATTSVAQADYLDPARRVVGVGVNGQWRAYPLAVLNWHEAVNDQLGGVPIGVFYCPLCDSVSVVDRRVDGQTLEFGISGFLSNSNVLLYDRTDNALWSQVKLVAISGPNAGKTLKHLTNWELGTFADFRRRHPDATVMKLPVGTGRAYGRNPYAPYFADERVRFPLRHRDARLPEKLPVIGVRYGKMTRAYPIDRLKHVAASPEAKGIITDRIGNGTVKLGLDAKTGTIRVIDAPAEAQVVHTFWFAWVAFHRETEIFEPAQ